MADELQGKSIVVTGAASGIGQAAARIFSRAGADLLLADINVEAGKALEHELVEAGAKARFQRTDVASEADVAAMIDTAVATYGKLDGAFNNAGIEYAGKLLHELSLEDWQRVVAVNLTGVFLCMKHEIAAMLTSGGGAIVNTGSVASVVGLGLSAEYNASKHGVLGLTRNASVDYSAKGIRVNALLVGAIHTPLYDRVLPGQSTNQELIDQLSPLRRLGKPEEIGQAAMWLLSDASSFVAGSGLTIDGGFTAA